MTGHWWSCVLGLLFMPAEVILSTLTVFQSPSTVSLLKVNSSTEITCSTPSSHVFGFYLRGRFNGRANILYLSLNQGIIRKHTTAKHFQERIHVTQNPGVTEGFTFTFRLSQLGLNDTDLYYCEWIYLNSGNTQESQSSNGTVLIIRDFIAQEECSNQILDHILISLSAAAFTVILFLVVGTGIVRWRRFNQRFTPSRAGPPPPARSNRPQHICLQHNRQHYPYWITSENQMDYSEIQ